MNSIGDHAQTVAIEKFLANNYEDYALVKYSRSDIAGFYKENVSSDDLIFISSSGDFGNLHINNGWHFERKKIISLHPNTKVVQLPVSVYYTPDGAGAAMLEKDKTFFSNQPNFLLLTRTVGEADFASANFGCAVKFFPDFVFYLNPPIVDASRKGALVVMRNDSESLSVAENLVYDYIGRYARQRYVSRAIRKVLVSLKVFPRTSAEYVNYVLCDKGFQVCCSDVQVTSKRLDDAKRAEYVSSILELYGRFKVVITDRFHAAVFAALMRVPCVAFKGAIPHKISGCRCLLPNTVFANSFGELDSALSQALSLRWNPQSYREHFDNFRTMVNQSFNSKRHLQVHNSDVYSVVKQRRSIRSWNNVPIERNMLDRIVEAGYFAPSAANYQGTMLKKIVDKETILFLRTQTSPWFGTPTAIILVMFDLLKQHSVPLNWDSWHGRFIWQDTACAMQNMMLTAESMGVKSCWASVNPEQEKAIKNRLKISEGYRLASMLFLGYSDQKVAYESAVHQGKPIKRNQLMFI